MTPVRRVGADVGGACRARDGLAGRIAGRLTGVSASSRGYRRGLRRRLRGAFSSILRSRATRAFSPWSDVTSVEGLAFHASSFRTSSGLWSG